MLFCSCSLYSVNIKVFKVFRGGCFCVIYPLNRDNYHIYSVCYKVTLRVRHLIVIIVANDNSPSMITGIVIWLGQPLFFIHTLKIYTMCKFELNLADQRTTLDRRTFASHILCEDAKKLFSLHILQLRNSLCPHTFPLLLSHFYILYRGPVLQSIVTV